MSHRLEKDIEFAIRSVLRSEGFVEEKNHQTMLNRGRPDLHASHDHWGEWWIEVKRPGQKLGARQWKWMLRWHQVCNVIVCDYEADIMPLIQKFGPRRCNSRPRGSPDQWGPWMTRAQKREVLTGRTPLDDAMDDWS